MPNGLYARPNTSDEGTWHDVFDEDKAYHRPPLLGKLFPKTIIDVGAYVGYTTIDLKNLYPDSYIIAIEPDEENYKTLLENVSRAYPNGGWGSARCAIWNYSGYGRLRGEHFNAKQIELGANVRVYTLDNIVEVYELEKIDYIKLDVEGAEKDILQLGGKWVDMTSYIKVEVHEEYYVSQCIADLNLLGFAAVQDEKLPSAVLGIK